MSSGRTGAIAIKPGSWAPAAMGLLIPATTTADPLRPAPPAGIRLLASIATGRRRCATERGPWPRLCQHLQCQAQILIQLRIQPQIKDHVHAIQIHGVGVIPATVRTRAASTRPPRGHPEPLPVPAAAVVVTATIVLHPHGTAVTVHPAVALHHLNHGPLHLTAVAAADVAATNGPGTPTLVYHIPALRAAIKRTWCRDRRSAATTFHGAGAGVADAARARRTLREHNRCGRGGGGLPRHRIAAGHRC